MSIQLTNSQVEAKVSKAIKGLAKTQTKAPTKQEFVIDAIDFYFAELVKKKFIQ